MNRPTVAVEGYLKYEPEMRFTVNGKAVCNFKLEDSELRVHRIVIWEELAEVCSRELDRNDKVMVVGQFGTRKWTDREGNEQSYAQITARRVVLLNDNGTKREIGKQEVVPGAVCLFCKYYDPSQNTCSLEKAIKDPKTDTCDNWRYNA